MSLARRVVLVGVLVAALAPATASGNGRPAAPANIRLHPTQQGRLLLGATFGLVESTDGGAATAWVCEDAIGYGGEYDPDYAFHPSRDEIWSTTFKGLRVTRDGGCTWTTIGAPFATDTWIGEVEIGGDGRVWAATSSGASTNDVYVSSDGETFTSVGLADATGWWESLKIAPQDPDRIYVTGYRTTPSEDGYIKKSIDGGASWTDVPETGIAFGMDPRMSVLGVSPVDPEVVFLRVLNAGEPLGDAIYRSADGGTTWTLVLQLAHAMRGFAISPDGQTVYAGTAKLCADDEPLLPDAGLLQKGCLFKSTAGGAVDTWVKAGYSPRLGPDNTPNTSNALAIDQDGTLYAGGSSSIDGWLVGKSTDGAATFTRFLAASDIDAPLECAEGTEQRACALEKWGAICTQIGACPIADAGPAADAGSGGGGSDCCAVAPSPAQLLGGALLALVAAATAFRRRPR
jgi:hypothetical protein